MRAHLHLPSVREARGDRRPRAPAADADAVLHDRLGAPEWGICTECGMGRVEPDDVLPMLDSYREILARLGPESSAGSSSRVSLRGLRTT
jgi:hypothetical protein